MIESAFNSLSPLAATIAPLQLLPMESLEWVHRTGYRAVQLGTGIPGLRPTELDRSARRGLRLECERRGIAIAGIDCFVPAERVADRATVDRAIGALERAVGLASDLGRVTVSISLPLEGAEEVRVRLEEIAGRSGVPIADYGGAPPTAIIGLGMDAAAVLGSGGDPAAQAARGGRSLTGVRLTDLSTAGIRTPPGESTGGRLDMFALMAALAVGGFSGYPVADARHWVDPRLGLANTLQRWNGLGKQ
ncbi:MAG: sugar phosphate isomerase/epimerase [Phycisphaerales bacterium]|nr:sugar phosphate isomerase/epimerase [Phycisphaerales bacterium]